jgi:hypothetical protein
VTMSSGEDFHLPARRFLIREAPSVYTVEDAATALTRSVRRLEAALDPVLGTIGFRTMLGLAIQRASLAYPFLQALSQGRDGLDRDDVARAIALAGLDNDEAMMAFEQLLATFFRLLAELLGVELTARIVEQATEAE